MELDLLYEIDVPKPWDGSPIRTASARPSSVPTREAMEQIRLADTVGFHTAWRVEHHFREGRSHCPAPEVICWARLAEHRATSGSASASR